MKSVSNFRCSGFTMIELMVGITIALLTVLVITQVFVITSHRARDVAGGNDAQQSAAIAGYFLSNAIREAGSNIHDPAVKGCALAGSGGGVAFPLSSLSTLPSFFGIEANAMRAAPLVILGGENGAGKKRTSDVLQIISGNSQSAGTGFSFTLSGNEMEVQNSNGITAGDYLLVAPAAPGGACSLLRVAASFQTNAGNANPIADTPQTIPLDTTFVGGLASMPATSSLTMFSLGQAPRIHYFGVDPSQQTLEMYDYLQLRGSNGAVSIADNVFLLRALYGIDPDNDGVLQWVDPRADGFTFYDLQPSAAPDAAAIVANLASIRAVRLALITRSRYPSGEMAPEGIVLFPALDKALQQTVTLTADERRYRYQVYETVAPLFNTTF